MVVGTDFQLPNCANCRRPLRPNGPSFYFCNAACQFYWHHKLINRRPDFFDAVELGAMFDPGRDTSPVCTAWEVGPYDANARIVELTRQRVNARIVELTRQRAMEDHNRLLQAPDNFWPRNP